MMISTLDIKIIAALQKQFKDGFITDEKSINEVINAIMLGKIRITKIADEISTFEDLSGDIFNEEANPDIPPLILKKEKTSFKRRINNSGVWTMLSEYWNGREWENLIGIDENSISGFVGNDFFGSFYELQLMQAALDAYNNQLLDSEGFVLDPFRLQAA